MSISMLVITSEWIKSFFRRAHTIQFFMWLQFLPMPNFEYWSKSIFFHEKCLMCQIALHCHETYFFFKHIFSCVLSINTIQHSSIHYFVQFILQLVFLCVAFFIGFYYCCYVVWFLNLRSPNASQAHKFCIVPNKQK